MTGLGALGPHESALVHGGGGGVGTAAILLMREEGRQCFVTVGSRDKAARCLELGATAAIDYKTEDFAARVRELTGGRGVDVVLDHIGGRYLSQNLECLAVGRPARRDRAHGRREGRAEPRPAARTPARGHRLDAARPQRREEGGHRPRVSRPIRRTRSPPVACGR